MEKLNELISKCKCSVGLDINVHRDYHESVETYLELPRLSEDKQDVYTEILQKMIELDTIVELQFYPDTSVGFYKIHHYDVEMTIDEALLTFNN